MSVRCKFQFTEEKKFGFDKGVRSEVVFKTAYDQSVAQEDAAFSKFTPQGELRATIDNPVALERLQLGEFYYIDITPVPKPDESA